jgi:hypothetical protein
MASHVLRTAAELECWQEKVNTLHGKATEATEQQAGSRAGCVRVSSVEQLKSPSKPNDKKKTTHLRRLPRGMGVGGHDGRGQQRVGQPRQQHVVDHLRSKVLAKRQRAEQTGMFTSARWYSEGFCIH